MWRWEVIQKYKNNIFFFLAWDLDFENRGENCSCSGADSKLNLVTSDFMLGLRFHHDGLFFYWKIWNLTCNYLCLELKKPEHVEVIWIDSLLCFVSLCGIRALCIACLCDRQWSRIENHHVPQTFMFFSFFFFFVFVCLFLRWLKR